MNINLKSTKDYASSNGVKVLVYGLSGSGKTFLSSTAPDPFIISAESGLLTLHDVDIPYVEIGSTEELLDVYYWVTRSEEAKQFKTICLDSISEICEISLAGFKEKEKNPMMAYQKMQDEMKGIFRTFRGIPDKNVYFSCKMDRIIDVEGNAMYAPSFPNRTVSNNVSYFFDEVFALRTEAGNNGQISRFLQTANDGKYTAKDRSGMLNQYEAPDLTSIFRKIGEQRYGEETD